MKNPASEHVPRWAARADAGIDRVDRMVRDLLDAMRAQAGGRLKLDLEACDLVEIARESVEALRTEHGERFSLVASEPVRGWFAREHMRRAIDNLAANAVKYGDASRVVTVDVRPSHGRAIVTVHNHGSYIPPEERETLFRAFHRLRGAGEDRKRGWGLGLAQVRAVAEAHGGSIGVDSLPDAGTTFVLDVPADARPYQAAPTTP
jgi:signal transduction histidine kinase